MIESIINCFAPRNVSDVKSFVGLASYYKIFFEGFFKITLPITELQRNKVKFVCLKNVSRASSS